MPSLSIIIVLSLVANHIGTPKVNKTTKTPANNIDDTEVSAPCCPFVSMSVPILKEKTK